MDAAFNRISYWIWGKKDGESHNPSTRYSQVFTSGFSNPDYPTYERRMRSNSGWLRRKWQSREERRVDKEYDIVLVPSDGECMSGSESDGSDWSVGWSEPHDPAFSNARTALPFWSPATGATLMAMLRAPKALPLALFPRVMLL